MSGRPAARTIATGLMVLWTISGIILAINLPAVGALIMAFAGLPAVLVILAWGVGWFCMYGLMTITATFFLGGFLSSLMMLPLVLIPAGILARAIYQFKDALKAIGVTLALATVISCVLWALAPLMGEPGLELWAAREQFRKQGIQARSQLRAMQNQMRQGTKIEIDSERMEIFLENFNSWTEFVGYLIPVTFLFLWHLLSLGIFYVGANVMGRYLGFSIPPLPQFSHWKVNWNVIWVLFLGWFLFYGADFIGHTGLSEVMKFVGANCLTISKILFFISGLSVIFYFFEFYQLSRSIRVGLSFIVLLFHQLPIWFGIADIWLDFRGNQKLFNNNDLEDDNSFF